MMAALILVIRALGSPTHIITRRVSKPLIGVLLGCLVSSVAGEEPLPTPEFPLIVAFNSSEFIRVRSIEDRGPAIVYMEMSGTLVSTPKLTIDMATTTVVNKALAAFTVVCENDLYDSALFELPDKAAKVFDTAADRENRTCWRRLQERHHQDVQRSRTPVVEWTAQIKEYPTATWEEIQATREQVAMRTPRVVTPTPQPAVPRPEPPMPSTGLSTGALEKSKELCREDWPDDYRMQAFCFEMQKEALDRLLGRGPSAVNGDSHAFKSIRSNCLSEWGANLRMVDFCEQQQIEGYHALR
jgi:hypothetical protein